MYLGGRKVSNIAGGKSPELRALSSRLYWRYNPIIRTTHLTHPLQVTSKMTQMTHPLDTQAIYWPGAHNIWRGGGATSTNIHLISFFVQYTKILALRLKCQSLWSHSFLTTASILFLQNSMGVCNSLCIRKVMELYGSSCHFFEPSFKGDSHRKSYTW